MMSYNPSLNTAKTTTLNFSTVIPNILPTKNRSFVPQLLSKRMWRRPHTSLLSFVLLVAVVTLSAAVTTLRTFRGCAVREFSFIAHKPGCRSLRIQTDACWGRCHTWEKPVPHPPYVQRHHRVCTYSRALHLTARLPGCRAHVSPLYPYPLALRCDCAACSSQDTECQTF
ncbi:hypothetical protein ANANG_G00057060 [Anguilla anguilla]|uniref:Glycoprotein hormone subunit beta domain-containing protein n=1 Tax=Anguilla anguilla TaxID=7936 RepID=A0A9D3MNH9_ANGAN|nr:hypothetical protein ANANG_G00057060 [Anguilla anguilla]